MNILIRLAMWNGHWVLIKKGGAEAMMWLFIALFALFGAVAEAGCPNGVCTVRCGGTGWTEQQFRNDWNYMKTNAVAGDTVQITAGTCPLTTNYSWSAPTAAGATTTLKGAGNPSVRGGGDATTIVDDYSGTNSGVLAFTPASAGSFRLAGITVLGGRGGVKENGLVQFFGSNQQLIIDHNHIDKRGYPQAWPNWNPGKFISLFGTVSGVIYENQFHFGVAQGFIHVRNGDLGDQGNHSWANATNFGGSNFLFIEDNDFIGAWTWSSGNNHHTYLGSVVDCHTSGRYVARYNFIQDTGGFQTHPTSHAGDDRGCRAHEIYHNTGTSTVTNWLDKAGAPGPPQPPFAFEYQDSGPALVWGNNVDASGTGAFSFIFQLKMLRQDDRTYPESPPPGEWGFSGQWWSGHVSVSGITVTWIDGKKFRFPCACNPNAYNSIYAGSFILINGNRYTVRSRTDDTTLTLTTTPPVGDQGGPFAYVMPSYWDGNPDSTDGYPSLDQVGYGQGDLLSGVFPNKINATRKCTPTQYPPCAYPRQQQEPMYAWSNTGNNASTPVTYNYGYYSIDKGAPIQLNRDVYMDNRSANCSTPPNCTTGVGVGTLAQMNAFTNCTPGVAFWATDAGPEWDTVNHLHGTLYKCTAGNTWVQYYQPQTYPHYLRTGGSPLRRGR